MKVIYFLLLFLCLSCSDNSNYLAADFRIFKDTKSWKLAKCVDNNDLDGIEREIAKDSSLLSFQERKYGKSVLHLAIYNDKFEAFKKLLELGFKLNLYDYESGASAFLVACGEMDEKVYYRYFDFFIKHGVDINQTMNISEKNVQNFGYSALMFASYIGNIKIVESLIKNKVDINYQNSDNRNAFSVAVNVDNVAIANLLLKSGSSCKARIMTRYDAYQNPIPVYVCTYLETAQFITRDEEFAKLKKLVEIKGCCDGADL